ncbi:hypothetical protein ABSA28_00920 [Candidatus Hepatincolaceae symbiont of Richtersius coronifer]
MPSSPNILNRLIISNGPYTSIISSSIVNSFSTPLGSKVENNYFLGYFKSISTSNHKLQYDLAKLGLDYKKLLSFNDYFKLSIFDQQQFLRSTDNSTFYEIYLPINSTTKRWHKIFSKLYPQCNFCFYEEGLMSYIKPIFDRKLRKIMANATNYYIFYHPQLKVLLNHYCPKIKFSQISKKAILQQLNTVKTCINVKVIEQYSPLAMESLEMAQEEIKKNALILPQYYYHNQPRKFRITLALYKKNIGKLLAFNYRILFKDHPKTKSSFFDLLQSKPSPIEVKPDFILLQELENYPIEIFANSLKPDLVFSVYSTSLWSLPYFFNIKTFTSYEMLDQRLNFLSIYPTLSCLLTKNMIKDINEALLEPKEIHDNLFAKTAFNEPFKTKNIFLNCYIKLLRIIL